jgi:tRNA 2-selenouridine synthase
MSEPRVITIDDFADGEQRFDCIMDARSPSEYALDHLSGAVSTPVLDDEERARVGTLYKQHSSFAAKRVGAAIVARNIAAIVDALPQDTGRNWQPLVYCWRGGNRSGALATVLARIGWRTTLLAGGYREYRRRVVADLTRLPGPLRFVVVAGRTGAGKSRLLASLADQGGQVLDLERLANHRGSVLGGLPRQPQPSQKRFESLIWDSLRAVDPRRPVYVESESKKVGQNHVPDALMTAIRAGRCLLIQADDGERVAQLKAEYDHFVRDPAALVEQVQCLVPLHGHARIESWKKLIGDQDWDALVLALLREHYDPAYDRSMQRNFPHLRDAPVFDLDASNAPDTARAILNRFER